MKDDRVAPSEMTRLSQFMADCMSVGALRGFTHFAVHIRSREEIILRIHRNTSHSDLMPISSLTISEHAERLQATEETRSLMARSNPMALPPDLSDDALEGDATGVNFLVAGYPRYKCPYVWLRTDHERLIVPSEEGVVERDVPLRLESIDCWRLYDIRPWDVMVEVICTAMAPQPPENPFAVDYGYFEKIPTEERVVATGAVLEFLRRVYLRHYFFSDVVMTDIRRLQKIHFRDINALREYQQMIVFREQTATRVE